MDTVKNLWTRGADYFNCRTMPHGGTVLVPIVLVTLALCASLADDGCDYARLRGAAVEMLTGSSAVPFVDCGMTAYRIPGFYPVENTWRVVYTDECMPYEYMNLLADTSWVAAEWLRFLSLVVGGTTTMFLWTSTCLTLRPNYWQAAGIGSAVACLCQMCSFVWFYTKLCHTSTTNFMDFEAGREVEMSSKLASTVTTECSLFFGSKCVITSCVLWAVSSAVILLREYPLPVPKLIALDEKESMVSSSQGSQSQSQSTYTTNGGSSSRRSRSKKSRNASFQSSKNSFKSSFKSQEQLTASMSTNGGQSQHSASARSYVPWVAMSPNLSSSVAESKQQDKRMMLRSSMRPAVAGNELQNSVTRPGSIRPASELSGSTFSAVSFA